MYKISVKIIKIYNLDCKKVFTQSGKSFVREHVMVNYILQKSIIYNLSWPGFRLKIAVSKMTIILSEALISVPDCDLESD